MIPGYQVVAMLRTRHQCEWCSWPRYGLGHELVKAEVIRKLRSSTFMLRYQVELLLYHSHLNLN